MFIWMYFVKIDNHLYLAKLLFAGRDGVRIWMYFVKIDNNFFGVMSACVMVLELLHSALVRQIRQKIWYSGNEAYIWQIK